jgi:hypothetical protein
MTTLVVFAGQSNALGFGMSAATLPAHLTTPNANAYIFGGTYWGGLQPSVNTGTATNPQAWGPEAEFAYRFGLDHPGETLLIVKSVKGSTGLALDSVALDWSPDSSGELFDLTDTAIDNARAAFTAATGQAAPGVTATFWMQGETDAGNATTAAAYDDNLVGFFAAARAEWMGDANGYIGFGRITDTAGPYSADVRVAQWAVDQADGHAESFKTIGFGMQADGVHYSAPGQVALGDGFYDAWAF